MYSSTLSLTSALDGDEWLIPYPGRFTPRKKKVPILLEIEWAQELSERVGKILSSQGFFLSSHVLCVYFIRTCFFILIVLHSALCLQHTIQASMPLGGTRNSNPSKRVATGLGL